MKSSLLVIESLSVQPWQRWTMRVAATRPVSWFLARLLFRVDPLVFRLSGQNHTLTSLLTGLAVIMLTSFGARSGLPRSTPLVALPYGRDIIVIASNFGSRRHPAWYHNLRANPSVIVTYKGASASYLTRLTQGSERDRYWQSAVASYPGYTAYASRAGARNIPVILLEPVE